MNCQEIHHYLDPLLDNELSVEESARILHHLDECASCQTQWNDLSKLRTELHDTIDGINVPAHLESSLRKAVAKQSGSRSKIFVFSLAALSTAAAVIAFFVFAPKESAITPIVASDIVKEEVRYGSNRQNLAHKENSDSQNSMQLEGWTMLACQDCQIANKPAQRYNFAKANDPTQTLSFYQLPPGQFKPQGMSEHDFDGTKLCCGEVGKHALVYFHGVGHDNVLVSNIPLNDLMSLALKNRITTS